MASLYADYLLEREGKELVETDSYFFIYKHFPKLSQLYIADFYVVPEARNQKIGSKAMAEVVAIAQELKCSHIACTTDTNTNNWEKAASGLIGYGFQVTKEEDGLIYFYKDI